MTEHAEHRLCHEDRVLLAQLLCNQATFSTHFSAFAHLYHQDQKAMEQALSDAISRATASEATAATTIGALTQTNASLVQANADLQTQLAAAQAAAGDPASEQAAADKLNTASDGLDAAVAGAQPPS